MASEMCVKRLHKDLKAFHEDPPPYIHVHVDETNVLKWSYLLEGPEGTPYEGGWYWGRLNFPYNYPFAPPSILMVTPSGRFETNTRLCFSMSDYHPETWRPTWTAATVLTGFLSFMTDETSEFAAGMIDPVPSANHRKQMAAKSVAWNQGQKEFCEIFPEFLKLVQKAGKHEALLKAEASKRGAKAAQMDGDLDVGTEAGTADEPEDETEAGAKMGDDFTGNEQVSERINGEIGEPTGAILPDSSLLQSAVSALELRGYGVDHFVPCTFALASFLLMIMGLKRFRCLHSSNVTCTVKVKHFLNITSSNGGRLSPSM